MRYKGYKPFGKRLLGTKKFLTERQYRERISKGKPIPRGLKVKFEKPKPRTPEELGIKFRADGSVEYPFYEGPEARLKLGAKRAAKSPPEAVRLVYHQIESVKSRVAQSRMIFDEVARLHYDLVYHWKGFNEQQRKAFSQYFIGILEKLSKNPALLKDENKIHACEGFVRASELLREGNTTAAGSKMGSIKNDMSDWLRKLQQQLPRLKRRQSLVIGQKFEREKRIRNAVDSVSKIYSLILGQKIQSRQAYAITELKNAARMLYATGWKSFKQPAIIIGSAIGLIKKGESEKAKNYLKDANKRIVLAASPFSSIYPRHLEAIMKSTDAKFKKTVLANQTVLFHGMMELWWNPGNKQKTALILQTVDGLERLAEGIERKDVAQLISGARTELEAGKLESFSEIFERAAILLDPAAAEKFK